MPFCATRCGYCDFNTYTPGELGSPRDLTGPYLDALDRELELAAARVGRPAETVFIGGGTPSLLGGQGLTRILNTVRSTFGLAPGAEVTTESNPESTSPEYFAQLADAGYTRIASACSPHPPAFSKSWNALTPPAAPSPLLARPAPLASSTSTWT